MIRCEILINCKWDNMIPITCLVFSIILINIPNMFKHLIRELASLLQPNMAPLKVKSIYKLLEVHVQALITTSFQYKTRKQHKRDIYSPRVYKLLVWSVIIDLPCITLYYINYKVYIPKTNIYFLVKYWDVKVALIRSLCHNFFFLVHAISKCIKTFSHRVTFFADGAFFFIKTFLHRVNIMDTNCCRYRLCCHLFLVWFVNCLQSSILLELA